MGCALSSSAHELSRATLSDRTAPVKALAFEGGGFLAHATSAGFTAGLLYVLRSMASGGHVPTLVDLFQRFSIISSVSGGSWYIAQLAYSEQFLALIDQLVVDPMQAGKVWSDRWIHRFLNGGAQSVTRDLLSNFLSGVQNVPATQLLQLLGSFTRQGEPVTWVNIVRMLLESTSDISSSDCMASPPLAWAAGKVWLVGTSIISPSEDSPAYVVLQNKQPSWSNSPRIFEQLKYALRSSEEAIPKATPAKFSWRFGSEFNDTSPFPFSVNSDRRLEYQLSRFNADGAPVVSTVSTSLEDVYDGAIRRHAGKLPLEYVVGSSSTLAGFLVTDQEAQVVLTSLHINFNVWITSAKDGQTFSVAEDVLSAIRGHDLSEASLQLAAHAHLHTLIDGGRTDVTGIAHAVAAGATIVTSVQVTLIDMIPLFSEGVDISGCGNIFAQNVLNLQGQLAQSIPLEIPVENASHLSGLSFGTLSVTTVENKHWGIQAGTQVTIYVFLVQSDLGIGFSSDFYNYGDLVQAVVATLAHPNNTEFVKTWLDNAM